MSQTKSIVLRAAVSAAIGAGALIIASPATATNNGLADWRDVYPNSNSDDAGCQLCHGSSLGQLNAYGRDICLEFEAQGFVPSDWTFNIEDVEGLDSDLDPNASDNATEIANDTQPGWTTADNPLFVADFTQGCAQVQSDSTVPSGVPLPYDIAVTGDPIANPNGPYAAVVGETIVFDGSGSTDDGDIVQYDWVFGDGTSAPDAGPNPEHIYVEDGVYAVVLTVTDNDRNTNAASTTATISPLDLLDLDIDTLSVSKTGRVGKSIPVQLKVKNNGNVLGQAIATVIGVQNGDEVYRLRLNVFDDIGKGTTTFDFGSYTPTVAGDILWTATIADEDPDEDMAEATTSVK
jgi:PKD repeat protein